ncbi:NUDIX domain-containing protein [Jiangella rhizosphaerae]|uniref:NUDIX hydrolase n=1 Tax=Jiangella rhizosphaerae TaxID=2293569 RepID=A0A418KQK9_9ACTN|nr:NUDIX hydrolase [Jiangella rhizosphaerae]RIQ22303.1 NUDIX hydrolase [Jiangella rhizosphaerae]
MTGARHDEDVRAEGEPEREFHAGIAARLPRKTVAGGALIRDESGLILFVEPAYKPTLEIPGGNSEPDESPLTTCRREVREELGLDLPIGRALVVDWIPVSGPWHDRIVFVFDGGVLDAATVARITPDPVELRGVAFLPLAVASDRLRPSMARRLAAAEVAVELGETLYAEFGRPVRGG